MVTLQHHSCTVSFYTGRKGNSLPSATRDQQRFERQLPLRKTRPDNSSVRALWHANDRYRQQNELEWR